MQQEATYLSYESTGYFTKLVLDYLSGSPLLQEFYRHQPNLDGIKDAILAREKFNTPRSVLTEVLQEQYANLPASKAVQHNLDLLAQKNTFTITTAHQPNIFTGPLYFIYKILHAIKLADELKQAMPENNFVPVYYMGSEDADLEELGFVHVGTQKLVWETKQTGAVGRMKVDKALLALIEAINGQTGVKPLGDAFITILRQSYTEGKTIQQATLEMVHALFADFGLVVLIPDNVKLKKLYHSVVRKELLEEFSHQQVSQTITSLAKNYKVQTGGRNLNLFYLLNNHRERIEREGANYLVKALDLTFTQDEILAELSNFPERFSANVILRGAFQETVLPNIAFIGGGGEIAYWLELKKVFDAIEVPFPVLILRNSFLLMPKLAMDKFKSMDFQVTDLFLDEFSLVSKLVKNESTHQLSLSAEISQAAAYYEHLRALTNKIDQTLNAHVSSLEKKALSKISELEKKMLRAEKLKYSVQQEQIKKIKEAYFPKVSLQERVENFSLYYATEGKEWLQILYNASTGFNAGFGVITY